MGLRSLKQRFDSSRGHIVKGIWCGAKDEIEVRFLMGVLLKTTMALLEQHKLDVRNIQAQMRDFFVLGQKVKIYHGSTNSTRAQRFEKDKVIDVSRLDRVLEINVAERFALVE